MMRIFLIGATGQVARSLREAAERDPDITLGVGRRPAVDLTEPASMYSALAVFRPDIVINPAAYTAVDKAETESDLAFAVNREGARNVAAAAAEHGAPIIHLSTDYVFDGSKAGTYDEHDAPNPLGVYGRSKWEGERALAEVNPRHVILRTSWVYAPFGTNFVRTVVRLASERDRLRVVDDQWGCPTSAADIAEAVLTICRQIVERGWRPQLTGVTHLAGPEAVTWCGFARRIVEGYAERGGRLVPVDPIATRDYPTAAARPLNSRLSTERLQSVFGLQLPDLDSSLDRCLDRIAGNQ